MANDNQTKSSLEESTRDSGAKPDSTPNATEEINPANDKRAIDVGESGQFAPGGYYNQLGVTKPDRINLDEQVADSLSDEKK